MSFCFGWDGDAKIIEAQVAKLGPTNIPVLITGETGTGKEVVAKALHELSGRLGSFVPIDTAALPPNLFESELFGYAKGAFTGAERETPGWIERAHLGTLFLDEIAEIPQILQAKFLRTLQERKVCRLGDSTLREIDIRVIAATNRDVEQAVSDGSFRSDLYFRIGTARILLPPLRGRKKEIERHLCHHAQLYDKEFTPAALMALTEYPWPGNMRELLACVSYGVTMSNGNMIGPEDLPLRITNICIETPVSTVGTLAEIERAVILKALESCKGDKTAACEKLGIGKTTLYRKLEEYRRQVRMRYQTQFGT